MAQMKRIRIPRFFQRPLIGVFALLVLVTILSATVYALNDRRVMLDQFENRGVVIASNIANANLDLLYSREVATIQSAVDQAYNPEQGVGYIFVVDDTGLIIAHTFAPRIPAEMLDLSEERPTQIAIRDVRVSGGGTFLDVTSPILMGLVGYVHVGMDKSFIDRQMHTTLIIQGLIMASILFAGLGFIYFQVNKISAPIVYLSQYAARVAADPVHLAQQKMDAEIQGISQRDDELGQLVANFQAMTGEIYARDQRLVERTRTIEVSAEVSRRLSTILDARQLTKEVVEQLRSAFGYYHAQIYFIDPAGENLVLVGGTGEAGQTLLERGHKIPLGKGLVGKAAQSNAPVLEPDTTQNPDWLPNPLLPDTRAEAAVPITVGSQVVGALDVQHDRVDGLSSNDVGLLQAIAGQVSLALQNARTVEQVQEQARREAMLASIGQRIQDTDSVEKALQVAVRELGRAMGKGATSVRLVSHSAVATAGDETEKGNGHQN
jgi:putative methionine-R-sulfoxide reductase with GAF domain